MANDITNGVTLTQTEIQSSAENKKKQRKTISQLPVFRNAVTLLNYTVELTAVSHRNMRRFTDSSIELVNDLMKSIGFAQESRGEERLLYITDALVIVYVLRAHYGVYFSRQVISKDTHNKIKKHCDNTVAQLVGWRDFVKREGCNSSSAS